MKTEGGQWPQSKAWFQNYNAIVSQSLRRGDFRGKFPMVWVLDLFSSVMAGHSLALATSESEIKNKRQRRIWEDR
jgi:hypothetical protein